MSLVVPFDGSELAATALVRATEVATVFDETVVAVSVIPAGNVSYAREHDWIGPEETFDLDRVIGTLHEQVTTLSPQANFRHREVPRHATPGTIAKHLRRLAKEEDASMVFIGSENAGHLVNTVSSVGETVVADEYYDVVIVRNRTPAKIAELREASPHRQGKSDFYVSG